MQTTTFNVAMSIRTYGTVTIAASGPADALALMDLDFIAENFMGHGSEEDFNYSDPEGVYLSQAKIVSPDGVETEIEDFEYNFPSPTQTELQLTEALHSQVRITELAMCEINVIHARSQMSFFWGAVSVVVWEIFFRGLEKGMFG